uniref:Microsomal glutathione S-transferase 3 n=1 Tax=Lotharella oceanica TaxID=641309 RepID=A0A7S2TYJ8_9EUKA
MGSDVKYLGPACVTFVYLGMYYVFMLNAGVTKRLIEREYKAKDKKFDRYFGQDRRMLRADRIHLNTLEHMVPFLGMMWLHAVYVDDVQKATIAGIIGTCARALYPFLLGSRKEGLGHTNTKRVYPSTMPQYAVMIYLTQGVARRFISLSMA